MSGTIATEVKLARMALRAFKHENLAINHFYKDLNSEFKSMDASGGVVNVKVPIRFQSYKGRVAQPQPYNQTTIPVKVDQSIGVAWTTNQIDVSVHTTPEKLYKELIVPAMREIATQVDLDLFTLVLDVANCFGTAGTTPSTFLSTAEVAGRLTDVSVPTQGRILVVNSAYQVVMADALKTMYNPEMVKDFLKKMYIGGIAQFETYISNNLPRLTKGTPGGTPRINGANQTGASIAIDGLGGATSTYKKGDVVTFASCYDVNPVNRVTQTYLKPFVVTADFTGASGNLSISPAIVTEGAYKNCSVSPANDDLIVQLTSAATTCMNNIAFYPDAFAFVSVPFKLPDMEGIGHTETKDGISCTVTKGWDVRNLEMMYRVDFLYGKKSLYPEQACRLLG